MTAVLFPIFPIKSAIHFNCLIRRLGKGRSDHRISALQRARAPLSESAPVGCFLFEVICDRRPEQEGKGTCGSRSFHGCWRALACCCSCPCWVFPRQSQSTSPLLRASCFPLFLPLSPSFPSFVDYLDCHHRSISTVLRLTTSLGFLCLCLVEAGPREIGTGCSSPRSPQKSQKVKKVKIQEKEKKYKEPQKASFLAATPPPFSTFKIDTLRAGTCRLCCLQGVIDGCGQTEVNSVREPDLSESLLLSSKAYHDGLFDSAS